MINKDTMFVQKFLSIWQIPGDLPTFLYHFKDKVGEENILRQNYSNDRKSMSVYGGVGKCYNKIMNLAVHFPSSADLHIHTKLLISKH